MPFYNTPLTFLQESIESILKQTWTNFELIIIDDCSTNESSLYVQNLKDNRIVYLRNDTNHGPAYSRNRGLDIAKGKYIVIMDSDDTSELNRIEKLVVFMENHPNAILCGTGIKVFGEFTETYYYCPERLDTETIRIFLLFGNKHIMFPIINNEMLNKHHIRYVDNYEAEDYRMWVDCSKCGKIDILSEPLYNRRLQKQSITFSKGELQEQFKYKIIQEQLDDLHYELTKDNKEYYRCLYSPKHLYDTKTKKIVEALIIQNTKYKVYDEKKFKKVLWQRWVEISCYGLKNQKGISKKLKVLGNIPIKYYPMFTKKFFELFFEKIESSKK